MTWAIKRTSETLLDGKCEGLLGRFYGPDAPKVPDHVAGHTIMVFRTREAARAHIRKHYSYITKRPDLRREPHCWRVPRAVKVRVEVTEVQQ